MPVLAENRIWKTTKGFNFSNTQVCKGFYVMSAAMSDYFQIDRFVPVQKYSPQPVQPIVGLGLRLSLPQFYPSVQNDTKIFINSKTNVFPSV